MSREFTFFQFDVDEDAVRRVLSSIPGVTPLPAEERDASEDGAASPDATTRPSGEPDSDGRSADTGRDEPDETAAGSPGVEAHLDDGKYAGNDRESARKWTGPSTPWPGAPTQEEADAGWLDRLRGNRLLIGGGVVALGLVSAAAVWFPKFRGDGDATDTEPGTGARRDEPEREPHADDDESRGYPVDVSPVIGMAFLAIVTVILRRVGAEDEA